MKNKQMIKKLHAFSMALLLLPILITGCVAGNSDPTALENNIKNFSESSFKSLVTIPTVKGKLQDKNGNPLSGMRVGSSFWVFEAHKRLFNETVFSGADGSFTIKTNPHTYQSHRHLRANVFITVASPWLQEEIKLANTPLENMCYHPYSLIVRNVTNKERDVGVIKLTKQIPEPTGSKRYTWSLKTTTPQKTFKLTINRCVKEIKDHEFAVRHPIIQAKAKAEGIPVNKSGYMVTEISLPSTLTKIGKAGFWGSYAVTGTLTIPKNVRTIESHAFSSLGDEKNATTAPVVVFETGSKLKSIGADAFWRAKLRNFKLPENLETIGLQAFGEARFFPQGKLVIPSKVSKIEDGAFQYNTGITSVDILSEKLKKTIRNYPLGEGLFSDSTPGITHVNLPKVVAESYYRFELITSFGDVQFNHQSRD